MNTSAVAAQADAFLRQSALCRQMGSAVYADLFAELANDLRGGGITATVLGDAVHRSADDLVGLRLVGSVHRLALTGGAPELAPYYPSLGGTWQPEAGWQAFRAVLARDPDGARAWLDRTPQTNEVGRAAALIFGLITFTGAPREVRLFEIGSSGGLLLNADHYRYVDASGREFGARDGDAVSIEPAWTLPVEGDAWPNFVERRGVDLAPIDVASAEGALTLEAYCWPDHVARLERLRRAIAVAREHRPDITTGAARDFVAAIRVAPGTTTVLWHSVMWQYLSHDESVDVRARIERLGASATEAAPFAHIALEPVTVADGSKRFELVRESWPGARREVLAIGTTHGIPLTAAPEGAVVSATWPREPRTDFAD